ncbi:MAG: hypothetical protein ACOVRJ_03965 [Roseateles sp.]
MFDLSVFDLPTTAPAGPVTPLPQTRPASNMACADGLEPRQLIFAAFFRPLDVIDNHSAAPRSTKNRVAETVPTWLMASAY